MFKPHGARMALRVPIALAGIGLASAGSALGAVNPDDPQSVRDAFAATILANNTISPAWTGSVTGCHPGTESPTSAAATIANVNYFRTMNRLAPVGLAGAAINAKAQAAALMFEANNDLSHSPGSNWACATAGGIEAAGRSNIALGIAGAQTVSAYVEDAGDYNDAAGHRRWILYPRARTFGTGSTTRANALWVIESTDGSRPSTDIVAWPSKGYVPWPLVYERWTVSSNLAPDADYTAARVTVSTGGALLAVSKQTVHDGYADNTLVFDVTIPDALRSAGAETAFDVTVTNVLVNGTARTLRYRTTAIPADTTDAPTAVTTTVTADAATIDWRSPAEPTSPVTGYRVTVVDGRGTPVFSQDVAADVAQLTVPGLAEAFYRADVRTLTDAGASAPASRMFAVGNPLPQSTSRAAAAVGRARIVRTGVRTRIVRLSLRTNTRVIATVQRLSPSGRWRVARRLPNRSLQAGVVGMRIGKYHPGRYRLIVRTPGTSSRVAGSVAVRFRVS
jgi:hypothetical protein